MKEPLSDAEIKRAMFAMKPWKTPGPDGFSAGFYQKSWDIIGHNVCQFVNEIWNNPEKIATINQIDIVLISKRDIPQIVTHFALFPRVTHFIRI